MLRFFHAPLGFSLRANVRFPAQQFRSSAEATKNGIIPFSHIYLTSASQLAHFRRFAADGNVLVTLAAAGADKILGHSRCPLNISFRSEGLETCLQDAGLLRQSAIHVAVVNGMGRGYGDNVSGMGALQHFRRFLASRYKQVTIDLLQRNCAIQSVVHTRYGSIDDAIQLPITVSQFFQYDVYADLSDLLSIPQFNDLPLYDFFLHGLSMQREIVNDERKRTALEVDPGFTAEMRRMVEDKSGCSEGAGRVVLFHPSASTPLRSMPTFLVERILNTLLAVEDVVVILCVNPGVQVEDRRVVDMRTASADICAFFGIIACCDAVITVGTVVYHVSGNLDIPTLLIPTVQADIRSAGYFPSVLTCLSDDARNSVSQKHMSRDEEDLAAIEPIWRSVKMQQIRDFINKV